MNDICASTQLPPFCFLKQNFRIYRHKWILQAECFSFCVWIRQPNVYHSQSAAIFCQLFQQQLSIHSQNITNMLTVGFKNHLLT